MKIQKINNYMSYKGNPKPIRNDEINKAKKFDVLDIKSKNINDGENFNLTIKKNVVSQVNEETNVDKINRIKDSINNKTYSIDVEEIVKILLK